MVIEQLLHKMPCSTMTSIMYLLMHLPWNWT